MATQTAQARQTRNEILTPTHKFWNGFWYRFGDAIDSDKCKCQGYEVAEKILRTLPNIAVEETIRCFKKKYLYCDCNVYLNRGLLEEWGVDT